MTAKDLLTALNDIDPKLLEDIDLWGAPAKQARHSPWIAAAAAVLAVCVGVGGWLFLSPLWAAAPRSEDTASQEVHLDFAENNTGSGQSTSWVLGNDGDTERALTEAELSSLGEQEGLSWMEGFQLSGSAYVSPEGEVSWMMVRGSLEENSQGLDAFVLYLQPGELPRCEARDVCSFLESANNQVNGADVWAAVAHSGRGCVDPETQESFSDDTTTYWTMFQQGDEDATGVALGVFSDQWGLEDQKAKSLAEQAVSQLLEHPAVLVLDSQAPLLEIQYASADSTQLDNTGISQGELGKLTTQSLNQEEISSLWKGVSWEVEGKEVMLSGLVSLEEEGTVEYAKVRGSFVQEDLVGAFILTAYPGEMPPGEELYRLSCLKEPNNTVEGVGVYAARFEEKRITGPREGSVILDLGFLLEGEQPVGITLQLYVDRWGFDSEEQAKEFAARTVGQLLSEGLDLTGFQPQEPTGPTDLNFAENLTGIRRFASWSMGDGSTRLLTEEELDALSQEEELSWMKDYQLSGQKTVTAQGEMAQLALFGTDPQTQEEVFTLFFQPGELPSCQAQNAAFFLEEPNNQLDETPVWAAVEQSVRIYSQGEEHTDYPCNTYWTTFVEPTQNMGVAVGVTTDRLGPTAQKAEELAEAFTASILGHSEAQSLLEEQQDTAPQTSSTGIGTVQLEFEDTSNSDSQLAFLSTFTDTYLAPRNLASGGSYHGHDLSQEQWESIWNGSPPWEDICGQDIYVRGTAEYSLTGEPIYVYVSGSNNKREACQLFHIEFLSRELSGDWAGQAASLLEKANNQVDGVDVYAHSTQSTVEGIDPKTRQKVTTLHWSRSAAFYLPDNSMVVNVTALGSAFAIPTQEECQELVEQITSSILRKGVSFSQLIP